MAYEPDFSLEWQVSGFTTYSAAEKALVDFFDSLPEFIKNMPEGYKSINSDLKTGVFTARVSIINNDW